MLPKPYIFAFINISSNIDLFLILLRRRDDISVFSVFFPGSMVHVIFNDWILDRDIFVARDARTIMSSAESRNGKVGSQRDSSPSEASPSAGPEGEDGKLGFSWGIVGRLIGK